MLLEFEDTSNGGQKLKRMVICCGECKYFKPFRDASGYGECMSKHTFDGAFRKTDFCSNAVPKEDDIYGADKT